MPNWCTAPDSFLVIFSVMGLRRKSRILALQFLFSHDFQSTAGDDQAFATEFELFCQAFAGELFGQHDAAGVKSLPYARHLVFGILGCLHEIDALLAEHSHNWRVARMSSVDRNILRIAVFEMQSGQDAPAQVVINEALEIAKHYSVGESVPFINGILDAVRSVGSDPA